MPPGCTLVRSASSFALASYRFEGAQEAGCFAGPGIRRGDRTTSRQAAEMRDNLRVYDSIRRSLDKWLWQVGLLQSQRAVLRRADFGIK